jgi:hypothetical protein
MAAIKCRFCGAAVASPLPRAVDIAETIRRNDSAYQSGLNLGRKFSAWWLIGIGAVAIFLVKSCAG